MKPHKHSEVIKAWADGHEIEFLTATLGGYWQDLKQPQWNENCEYRIKPAEPEREYPRTQLTGHRLSEMRDEKYAGTGPKFYLTAIVNDAFRHACDNGQIVTRAEFDRAVGDRAARDMAVAEAMKSVALDWAGRQLTSMPKRLENIDTGAVIASVK